jgi:hypothetical protein
METPSSSAKQSRKLVSSMNHSKYESSSSPQPTFPAAPTRPGKWHPPHPTPITPISPSVYSGRYGLISDDEPDVVEHWPRVPSPTYDDEEIDSNMDEDEDTTSVDIKVYEGFPVQKEDTTVPDDMRKLQNDLSRVDVSAL